MEITGGGKSPFLLLSRFRLDDMLQSLIRACNMWYVARCVWQDITSTVVSLCIGQVSQ